MRRHPLDEAIKTARDVLLLKLLKAHVLVMRDEHGFWPAPPREADAMSCLAVIRPRGNGARVITASLTCLAGRAKCDFSLLRQGSSSSSQSKMGWGLWGFTSCRRVRRWCSCQRQPGKPQPGCGA